MLQKEILSNKTEQNGEPLEKKINVDNNSEDESVASEPAQPNISSLSEAIDMLHDLADFDESR